MHKSSPFVLDAADLARLRCPLTGQRLALDEDGEAVVTPDGQVRYPVIDGVICLTVDAGQARTRDDSVARDQQLNPVTAGLQRFYDDVGWRPSGELFNDAELFEDLRPVAAEYIRRCHLRVGELLPESGEVLLDAGSGPVQFPEYLTYHEGFRKRLCVDISLTALRQARNRLGDRGIYVQADLARMPLADASVDAVLCLHAIYHVPAELQEQAFLELYRVLRPGGRAIIVYSWARPLAWRLAEAPVGLARQLRQLRLGRLRLGHREPATPDGFYFHPHSLDWFQTRPWPFATHVAVWRFLSVPSMKLYFHRRLGGRYLLRAVFWAESRWPRRLARYATYPLIVIDRSPAPVSGRDAQRVRPQVPELRI